MVKRFHLGYSIDRGDAFYSTAKSKGFSDKYLIDTGLCIRSERRDGSESIYDRFRGRVMYPIHSVAGRVVGFGGRTMRTEKTVAKYVNSPESLIYKKNRELYGLYQAKSAISKKDKCILVEGYMDVISMHQAGIENVVASSGTSLTEGQIRAIRRFTSNITLIYDSDAAGIKASLRGIDMLLGEGLSVKVLLLPEGDDPDSFAQSHSSSEVEAYIREHEQDVIAFMTDILMREVSANDPTARAGVVNRILRSVSMVSDPVTRSVYTEQCSRRFGLSEELINKQLNLLVTARIEELATGVQRRKAAETLGETPAPSNEGGTATAGADGEAAPATSPETESTAQAGAKPGGLIKFDTNPLLEFEKMIVRYVARYGLMYLFDISLADGEIADATVYDYVASELAVDDLVLSDPALRATFDAVGALCSSETRLADREDFLRRDAEISREELERGRAAIRESGVQSVADLEVREQELSQKCAEDARKRLDDFDIAYGQRYLLSSPDDTVRSTATDLITERHVLSKIHTKFAHVESEQELLPTLVPRAIYELKAAILAGYIEEARRELAATDPSDTEKYDALLQSLYSYQLTQKDFARTMGERIILPRGRR